MEQDQNAPVSQAITVSIYGQPYHLRGVDHDHIERLAALVDGKMRAVSSQGHTVDSLRVAVLAALNIADELEALRARHSELVGESSQQNVQARAHTLTGMLDELLADDAARRVG